MARRKKIYEGKAKILYEGPEPGTMTFSRSEGADSDSSSDDE